MLLLGTVCVKNVKGLWSKKIITLDMKIHDLNFLSAQMTANASRSMVDQRDWVSDSFMLANAINFSVPSDYCIRQQPTATALASIKRPKSCEKSIVFKATQLHSSVLSLSKAFWCSVLHGTLFGMCFCVKSVMILTFFARDGMKLRK